MAKRNDIERVQPLSGDSFTVLGIGQEGNTFEEDLDYLKSSDEVARLLNEGRTEPAGRDIWASTGSYGRDKYISGQGTLEALLGLNDQSKIGVWDIETIGSPEFMRTDKVKNPANFFSVTEIAMKMVSGKDASELGVDALSILVRPDNKSLEAMDQALGVLKRHGWTGLSEDMRRTLSDVTQYGGGAEIGQKDGYTFLKGHGRKFKDTYLGSKEGIAQIEKGINNLRSATPIEKALMQVNAMVDSNTVLAGHNVHNFDQRAMLDVLSATKQHFKGNTSTYKALDNLHQNMQKSQLDTLEFFRTYYEKPLRDFGGNMTLGNIYGKLEGRVSESAHFALADINMNISLLGKALRDGKQTTAIEALKRLSANTVQMGQTYYANRGIGGDGKYDAIYDKDSQGKFIRAQDFRTAAINKNNHYEVVSEVQKMQIGGKDRYGVTLLNKDTGYYHQIVRDRFDDIANIFQKNMSLEDAIPEGERRARQRTTELDRARRAYDKLFDVAEGKGTERIKKNYAFLDAYDAALAELKESPTALTRDIHQTALEGALERVNAGVDDKYKVGQAFGTNALNMRGRLDSERAIWEGAIDQIEKADFHYRYKDKDGAQVSGRDRKQETLALRKVKDQLEGLSGGEKERYLTPGVKHMSMTILGENRVFSMSDKASFTASISNALNKKGLTSQKKQAFIDMVSQFESEGIITKEQRKKYVQMAQKRFSNNEALETNALKQIANDVWKGVTRGYTKPRTLRGPDGVLHTTVGQNGAIFAGSSIQFNEYVEGTAITKSPIGSIGHQAMTTGVNGQHGKLFFEDIVRQSIQESGGYAKYRIQENVFMNLPKTVRAKIEEHEAGARMALEKSGLINYQGARSKKNFETKVLELANSYAPNFGVRVDYNQKTNKMMMFLSKKDESASMMNMSMEDMVKSGKVAHFEIPMMQADGTVEMGGQQFVGRLSAKTKGNTMQVTSVVDDFFEEMKNHAYSMSKKMRVADASGRAWEIGDVHGKVNGKIRSLTQGLVTNNSKYEANPEKEYRRRSQLANHNRAMQIDLSGIADQWYMDRGVSFGLNRAEQIQENMGKNNVSFFDAMSKREKAIFLRDVDGYYNERIGDVATVSSHGLSDSQALRGVRTLMDNREYFAFGEYNPTARENLNKALNYRALASTADEEDLVRARLERQYGKAGALKLMGMSTTNRALEIQGDEISHLNVRAALTSEFGVSAMVRGAQKDIAAKIEEAKLKGLKGAELEKLYAIQRELEQVGKYSIHDGMILASRSLQEAFEVVQESSASFGVNGKIHPALKKLMEEKGIYATEGVTRGGADQRISFRELQEAGLVEERNGSYRITVGEMTKMDDGRFVRQAFGDFESWNKDISIVGMDAETGKAIIETRDKAGQGMKFVTLGGGRHTARFLNQDTLDFITGQTGVEAIMPEVEIKKKMGGTYARSVVDTYVSDVNEQIMGVKSASPVVAEAMKKYSVANLTQEGFHDSVLDEVLSPALKNLGLDGQYAFQGGRLVLNSRLNEQNTKLTKQSLMAFDAAASERTGFERVTAKGFEVVNEGFAKHDIYTYESAGEKVRMGKKEMNVIRSMYGQHMPSGKVETVVGGADYTRWLEADLESSMRGKKAAQGIMGELLDGLDRPTPQVGDVVIDFSGATVGNDVDTVFDRNGVKFVDEKALVDTKRFTAKDIAFIAEDYAGSIINHKGATVLQGGERTKIGQLQRGRSFMMLPEEFGENRLVQLLDTSSLSRLDESTPMLLDVQKQQLALYSKLKQYQGLGTGTAAPEELLGVKADLMVSINESVRELEKSTAQFASSSRDGGLQNKLTTAKVSNSAQFRVQAANPFLNMEFDGKNWTNTGNYQEGAIHISKNRMLEMISGNERNIAGILMGEDAIKGMDEKALRESILERLDMHGEHKQALFGNVNRYPTIMDSTFSAMRFVVDSSLDPDDRTALVTVGSLKQMAGDTDGDVINGMLNHYKDKNAKAFHDTIGRRQAITATEGIQRANDIMNGYRDDLANTYHGVMKYSSVGKEISMDEAYAKVDEMILGAQKGNDVTVKSLTLAGFDTDTANDFLSYKSNIDENVMTLEARLGKGAIGSIDNMRESMRELHTMTQTALVKGGMLDAETAARNSFIVQNFGATLSQELISSKKLTIDKYIKEIEEEDLGLNREEIGQEARRRMQSRHEQIANIENMLKNPNAVNRRRLVDELSELGIFNGDVKYNGERISKSQILYQGLDELGLAHSLTAYQGGMASEALAINRSSGMVDLDSFHTATLGQGFMPTTSHHEMYTDVMGNGQERFDEMKNRWEEKIINQYKEIQSGKTLLNQHAGSNYGSTASERIAAMGTSAMSEGTGEVLSGAKQGVSNVFDGLKRAALSPVGISFAAIWGASALMRGGPTPEGLEEQQMASQAQVAPEQLLTSPTARVTTTGESTMLKISGRGTSGLDHNALAGIVNQEVQQMSGMSMQMNVNVNDNTAQISNRWIQEKLNESLNQ